MSRLHVYHFVVYKIDYPQTLLEGCTYLVKDKEINSFFLRFLTSVKKHNSKGIYDNNLKISDCMLVCSDHPSNTERRGFCLYCKNNLLLKVINVGYLNECLTLKPKIGNKICNFAVLYRSLT